MQLDHEGSLVKNRLLDGGKCIGKYAQLTKRVKIYQMRTFLSYQPCIFSKKFNFVCLKERAEHFEHSQKIICAKFEQRSV